MQPFSQLDPALEAIQCVARYDSMRLETYREKEKLTALIGVSRIGPALALRFDEVGYFNRVYSTDETVFERLAEIEKFYCGGPFGCELVGPPSGNGIRISRPGWRPSHSYAWMHAADCRPESGVQQTEFCIRAPEPSEREQFLNAYLRGFEAEEARIPAALRNMLHLFDRPELVFLMAWRQGRPAGVGMMMRLEHAALLCAGAALPECRQMGCHTALVSARIQLAYESGLRRIFSWAIQDGQSQANLERAGLAVAGTTQAWRFSPAIAGETMR